MLELPDTPEACRDWLANDNPDARSIAAMRLTRPFPGGQQAAAVSVAVAALAAEPDTDVRYYLMKALRRLDPGCSATAAAARDCLSDSDPQIRIQAVQHLGRRPFPVDNRADISRVWESDPDESVRAVAALQLSRVDPDPGMAPAVAAILGGCPDWYGRAMAVLALGNLGPAALPFRGLVEAAWSDPDESVRGCAEGVLTRRDEADQPVVVVSAGGGVSGADARPGG